MSYLQFPKTGVVAVLDTGDKLDLGGFQPATNGELRHVIINMMKVGTLSGSVACKIGLHLSDDFSTSYAESDQFFISAIESEVDGSDKTRWRAWVRFDFNRPNLNKNQLYRLSLQLPNYTRNGDTFYIGAIKDDPNNPIYANGVSGLHEINLPLAKSVMSYQEPV
jgi:hypothetical protein